MNVPRLWAHFITKFEFSYFFCAVSVDIFTDTFCVMFPTASYQPLGKQTDKEGKMQFNSPLLHCSTNSLRTPVFPLSQRSELKCQFIVLFVWKRKGAGANETYRRCFTETGERIMATRSYLMPTFLNTSLFFKINCFLFNSSKFFKN